MAQEQIKEILSVNVDLDRRFVAFLNRLLAKSKDQRVHAMVELMTRHMKRDLALLDRYKYLELDRVESKDSSLVQVKSPIGNFDQLKTIDVTTLFLRVLEYQQSHLNFYRQLRDMIYYKKSLDVCDTLIQLKRGEIKDIRKMAHDYALAV